jgi:hypothetical protein
MSILNCEEEHGRRTPVDDNCTPGSSVQMMKYFHNLAKCLYQKFCIKSKIKTHRSTLHIIVLDYSKIMRNLSWQ